MEPVKILFEDGHDVTVTDSFLKVKKSLYQLKGITKHGLSIIHPHRLAPFLTLLLGGAMIVAGVLRLVPENFGSDLEFYSVQLTLDTATMALGILTIIVGAILLLLMKDRYAIRIGTAEGERNVIISSKREYINRILDALNHAFIDLTTTSSQQRNRLIRK